jgi:hypothetical protein
VSCYPTWLNIFGGFFVWVLDVGFVIVRMSPISASRMSAESTIVNFIHSWNAHLGHLCSDNLELVGLAIVPCGPRETERDQSSNLGSYGMWLKWSRWETAKVDLKQLATGVVCLSTKP